MTINGHSRSGSKKLITGAVAIVIFLALCIVGLLILSGKSAAQQTESAKIKLLAAPLMFNIDTLEIENHMRKGVVEYLRKGLESAKAQNPGLAVTEILDKRDLGYDLWREHDFSFAGYFIPYKERMQAAAQKTGADVVITVFVHFQTMLNVRDNTVYVALYCYDRRTDDMKEYDEEWEDIPIATAYYEVEDMVAEALENLGMSGKTEEAQSGSASEPGSNR